MENNSFSEIAEQIKANHSFAIYPHTNMDGDAIGSSAALCLALRQLGKKAWIIIDEDVPDNLSFLAEGLVSSDEELARSADMAFCIDSGAIDRIGKRGVLFEAAKISACIDHHSTSENFCDYAYIDSKSAATGQLVFLLLKELCVKPDQRIANSIFAAITTDTGNFQYSNTQKITHEIVAELYDWGVSANDVSIEIYESDRLERLKIEALAISKMRRELDGKLLITYVDQDMLKQTGAFMYETDRIVNLMRAIKGTEVSVLVKEYEKSVIKISMRSKQYFDVARLCAKLGGGGHARAAGATLNCSLEKAIETVINAFDREV